jgi:hypothetical protein
MHHLIVVVSSLGKSVSPEDMVSGIESITDGIILAVICGCKATFDPKNAPNVAWGRISSAFSAFSNI